MKASAQLYAGTGGSGGGNVYVYQGGSNWTAISPPQGLGDAVLDIIQFNGTNGINGTNVTLYAATMSDAGSGEVWRYDGGTSSWTIVGTNMDNEVFALAIYNGQLYAGTCCNGGKLYRYNGTNFVYVGSVPGFSGINAMYSSSYGYLHFGNNPNDNIGHYDGLNLYLDYDANGGSCIYDFAQYSGNYSNKLYAGAYEGILYGSTNGTNWSLVLYPDRWDLLALQPFQGKLYLGDDNGVLAYIDPSEIWHGVLINSDSIISMVASGNANTMLYFGTGQSKFGGHGSGPGYVYAYTGNGATDATLISGPMGDGVKCLFQGPFITNCSPGTTFNVTGGTNCAPVDVGLDGSETNVDYWLVLNGFYAGMTLHGTGTNLDFGNWSVYGIYTVWGSNTTTTCGGWMNGSVTVKTTPIIITQPTNTVVVATNAMCAISVVASGGDLTYQWRRNGVNLTNNVGDYIGVTNADLVIYPTTTNDAATSANGYDCVISNSCGSITSTPPVALTTVPARTLYWVGQLPDGTPAPVWDVVTTTNWTTCTECSSIRGFEFGDTVRFDDNTVCTINVILGSSFLTPSSVTLYTYQAYSFSGPGSITGPGWVLWMGHGNPVGSVSITNANSYWGGTIVSNILVNVYNNAALGVSNVTLIHGAIVSIYGALELANNINVASDCAIQVTDPSSLILDGTLSGNGTILGSVTISSGTLSPGSNSIGTLTITNTLSLQTGSTTRMEVNKTAGTNDLVRGMTSVTYGGTLFVTNLSGTLTNGDTFKLFDATSYSGAFASITPQPGIGLYWNTNTLTTDGTLRIKSGSVITTFGIESRTNFWFSGTNGVPSSGYSVLSSTNVELPLTNWVLESSGAFDDSGVFNVTNDMQPGIMNKFFLLRVPAP